MTSTILRWDELRRGIWIYGLIPYERTSCPEDREDVVECVAEELADLLEATAEDELAVAAVRGEEKAA